MKQELNISNQQLGEWIDEWQESLFRYAFFRVGDRADAEDIVQDAFLKILSKVCPLLLGPFFVALFLKHYLKGVHRWLMEHSGMAFYIWAFALALVMGQTARSLFNSDASAWIIALGGLISCVVQFILGKTIGSVYKDRISAGQALGQKNTVLAIWMASAYLHPLATIAPGSYVLWQNIINSYQLWKKRKKEV